MIMFHVNLPGCIPFYPIDPTMIQSAGSGFDRRKESEGGRDDGTMAEMIYCEDRFHFVWNRNYSYLRNLQ